ncbi:MAG: acyltransferase family protein [Treponema sp.]|nr:acyltransferase family protein [Treponema sp.]
MESSLQNQRIQWLDTAKCIGIFLVILGHLEVKTYGFFSPKEWVYSFHMPLFFWLSGLTHKPCTFKDNLKKSLRQLAVPYVFFYLVTWAWWFVVSCLRHPEIYPDRFYDGIVKPLLGMFIANGYNTSLSTMANVPLWFLAGLFWCKLLFTLIDSLSAKHKKLVQVVLCAVLLTAAFVLKFYKIPELQTKVFGNIKVSTAVRFIPFSLGTLTLSYVFFFAGTLIKKWIFTNSVELPKKNLVSVMILCLVFGLISSIYNSRTDINSIKFGKDLLLFTTSAFAGIAFICALSVLISPVPAFFAFMGRNSITILAFHGIATGLFVAVLKYGLHFESINTDTNPLDLLAAIGVSIVAFCLCAVPAYILEKWFPVLLGRKKSNLHSKT